MATPRIFVDDPAVFPTVAGILDAMPKIVDPKIQIVVQYLASIDSSVPTGVLPSNGAEGSSKASKAPKKKNHVEKSPIVKVEVMKEIIPLKSGILKRTKKPRMKPTESPIKQPLQEPEIETTERTNFDSLNTLSSQKSIKKICKPQFNRKCVLFREVSVFFSPTSKKHQALDMDQKLQKKK